MAEKKYRQELCGKLIELMSTGISKKAVAGSFGISEVLFYSWIKQYPEFAKAVEIGDSASALWWEQQGIKGMKGEIPNFNASIWIFNMKNRFKWRDRQDVTSDDKGINVLITKFSDIKEAEKGGKAKKK